jgi:hypothetical protein
MWRLATWSSRRADGNLYSPIVYYALQVPFCLLWAIAAVRAAMAGRWQEAVSLGLATAGGVALLAGVRRRARRAMPPPPPIVGR